MDHFGIGVALHSVINAYFSGARRTGRTSSLVASVKDGDRIYFSRPQEAVRVKRLCAERGVNVECRVLDPQHLEKVFEYSPPQGRALFDHTLLEEYYLEVFKHEIDKIDYFQKRASGAAPPSTFEQIQVILGNRGYD